MKLGAPVLPANGKPDCGGTASCATISCLGFFDLSNQSSDGSILEESAYA
jgi:hypothetical protein